MLGAIRRLIGRRSKTRAAHFAMVLLPSDRTPSPELVLGEVRRQFPDLQVRLKNPGGKLIEFEINGCSIVTMHLPIPMGRELSDEVARRSWMWADAREKVVSHQTHVHVIGTGPGSAFEIATATARVAAGVCSAGRAIGVYWSSAEHVIEASSYLECVGTDQFPMRVLVSVVVSQNEQGNRRTLTTVGLESLGHRDFEVLDSTMPGPDLVQVAWDLAAYVVMSGPVLLHGQTISRAPDAKWAIEHAESRFNKGKKVIRLHIP